MIVVYNNFKKKSHEICVAFFHILVYVVILIIVEKKNLQLYPKKNLLLFREDFFVGLLGLEPRKTAPKTVVLPLHHRPVCVLRVQI